MPYTQKSADFNEATYGLHLTFEIQRWLKDQDDLDGVARLPTLRDEADLGYDVSVPARWGLLYLQFKMPEFMYGARASEFGVFNEPYFRFPVKTDATTNGKIQHNVLLALEESGESVFYAAPSFLTGEELSRFALNDGMYLNSVFPRPSDLGEVVAGSLHRFAWTDDRNVRAFSDPGPLFDGGFGEVQSKITGRLLESQPVVLEQFVEASIGAMMTEVEPVDRPRGSQVLWLTSLSNSIGLQPFLLRGEEGEGVSSDGAVVEGSR